MKKKVFFLRLVKLLCLFLCVVVLSSVCLSLCFYYDYTGILMSGLYKEPEDTLDVVILGASEVFVDYSAAYAYDLYGFTSYPYAWDAATGQLYEAQVRQLLQRQDPKWIVVEINGLLYDDAKEVTNEASLRAFLDHTPMSTNKVRTIFEHAPREDWYRYFFPLAKYHANWKTAYDQGGRLKDLLSIKMNGSVLKGYVTHVVPFEGPDIWDVTGDCSTEPLEPQAQEYLISFLNFCRESGLENVLFVRFPHIIADDWNYGRFRRCNEAERIIREYGYDFVNMERDYEAIGLDFKTDFYNQDHLNYRGQKKLTEYFGRMMVEEYGVGKSDLTPEQQTDWEKSGQYIRKFFNFCAACEKNGNYDIYYETRALMEQLDAY